MLNKQSWERLIASLSGLDQEPSAGAECEAKERLGTYSRIAPSSGTYMREEGLPQIHSWGLDLLSQATEVVAEEQVAAAPPAPQAKITSQQRMFVNPFSQFQPPQEPSKPLEPGGASRIVATTTESVPAALPASRSGKRPAPERDAYLSGASDKGEAGVAQPLAKTLKVSAHSKELYRSVDGRCPEGNHDIVRRSSQPLLRTSRNFTAPKPTIDNDSLGNGVAAVLGSPAAVDFESSQKLQHLSKTWPPEHAKGIVEQQGGMSDRESSAQRLRDLRLALQRQLGAKQQQQQRQQPERRTMAGNEPDAELPRLMGNLATEDVMSSLEMASRGQGSKRDATAWDRTRGNNAAAGSLLQHLLQQCQTAEGRYNLQQRLLAERARRGHRGKQANAGGAEHAAWRPAAGGNSNRQSPPGPAGGMAGSWRDGTAAHTQAPEGWPTGSRHALQGRDPAWQPAAPKGLQPEESLPRARNMAMQDQQRLDGMGFRGQGAPDPAQPHLASGDSQRQAEQEQFMVLKEGAAEATTAAMMAALEASYGEPDAMPECMNQLLSSLQQMATAQHGVAMHRLRTEKGRISRREGRTLTNAVAAINAAITASGWAAVSRSSLASNIWQARAEPRRMA